jgi:S1-C subfamily serine protease
VDGRPVLGVNDLQRLMDADRIGVECSLAVVRDGAQRTVALVPREL